MDNLPNTQPSSDAASGGIPTLSVEQILQLEQKLRENKAATLRGEPPVHNVTPEEVAAAINGMRMQRGTMDLTAKSKTKASTSGGKAVIQIVDLEGL